jgi:hypothetical protein
VELHEIFWEIIGVAFYPAEVRYLSQEMQAMIGWFDPPDIEMLEY